MTYTVIGVDPSLTRTGVAVWREGRVSTFSVPTSPADGPRVVRERIICGKVMPWVHRHARVIQMTGAEELRPVDGDSDVKTVAVVEAVHMQKFTGRSALDLAGLHDVLVYGFHARGADVGVAVPQVPKIVATGRGNASKPQMVHAAEDLLGVAVANPDEADAAWLMVVGLLAGGYHIELPAAWQQARMDAIDKVQWVWANEPLPANWMRGES